ncbi:MAG: hypothetical protein AB7O88_05385 [Reyranellaceae bacterium]
MAYGNLNPGVIFIRCLDGATLKPVEGATVLLTWLQADAAFGGRLQLYDEKGEMTAAPSAETSKSGVAPLKFFWDPAKIGEAQSVSDSPAIRVSAVGPAARYGGFFTSTRVNDLYFTTRVGNEHVFLCMNFGAAWSGGKGAFQFNSGASNAMDAASKVKDIIDWSWKWEDAWIKAAAKGGKFSPYMPKLVDIVNNRPTPELYAFVGGFDVMMDRQA